MISRGKAKGTVFSLGYQMREINAFVELLANARVSVVIDVRETPWSHKVGFSKHQLEKSLADAGIEYAHAKFAGNPKAIRAQAKSHEACLVRYSEFISSRPELVEQLDNLIKPRLEAGENVCLICYERHHDDCHRSILINQWIEHTDAGFKIEHLGPDGCDRLIKSA